MCLNISGVRQVLVRLNRNLRITLKNEGNFHQIDSPFPDPSAKNATPKQVAAYQDLLAEQDKIEEGQSVSSYVLKMKSYIKNLERLGHHMPHVLAVNTVLGSLPKSFVNFVMNYKMQGWDNKSLGELHAMLKTTEKNMPSKMLVPSLHMISDGGVKKSLGKRGKGSPKIGRDFCHPLRKRA
ncbi:hypothetical protein Tco_0013484 [Tanacetum coccineum]